MSSATFLGRTLKDARDWWLDTQCLVSIANIQHEKPTIHIRNEPLLHYSV